MNATQAVIGPVRFSYVHVWEPQITDHDNPKAKAKYSVSIIIPKTDKKSVEKIKAAYNEALKIGIEKKFGGVDISKNPNFKKALRDGDAERPDDEAYANSLFFNASCETAPGVIDENKNKMLDKTQFYSGCYGYVSVNMYAFNKNGNKGITAGLNNVMKTADGDPLGGRNSAEDDFSDIHAETPKESWE